MYEWRLATSVGLLIVLGSGVAAAAESREPAQDSNQRPSTTITSQKMTVFNKDRKALFEGDVVLTRGDLVVRSDKMLVSFKANDQGSADSQALRDSSEGKPRADSAGQREDQTSDASPLVSNRALSKIEATGRVRIQKANGRATCGRAVYYQDEDKIVLTEKPVAWQRGTRVTGQKITMFLADDRSIVEGQSKVLIAPDAAEGG
ncbi:MAG: LptA/OstA family protein [Nitrospiraceae bacterium]